MHVNFATKKKRTFKISLPKKFELNRMMLVVVASLVVVFMLSYTFVQKIRLDGFLKERMVLENEIAKAQSTRPVVATATPSSARGKYVLDFINRTLWSDVMQNITKNIPKGIWLSQIKTDAKNSLAFELAGEAPDQLIVASLIQNLKQTQSISSVKLVSSEKTIIDNKSRLKFLVRCQFNKTMTNTDHD